MIQSSDSAETREFLQKIMELLIDYVNVQNDRKEKILDFHHPEDMKKLLSLDVPDDAVTLQQLVKDCALTLKYQVKTGKFQTFFFYLEKSKRKLQKKKCAQKAAQLIAE